MNEPLTHLLVPSDTPGVPVIMENVRASEWPQYREATDEEYAAYYAYWTQECPVCGEERGEHCPHADTEV